MYEQISQPQIRHLYETLGVRVTNDTSSWPRASIRAAYSNKEDAIELRPEHDYNNEYDSAVLLHELVHWTQPRVGRNYGRSRAGYSQEEIAANIGAELLITKLGLGRAAHDAVAQNALQYLVAWMVNDPRGMDDAFAQAERDAKVAVDYILSRVGTLPQQQKAA